MDFDVSTGMKAFRWTLTVAALGMFVVPAEAALCVKRSGVVVARATCKQKETVLGADVVPGLPGPAGAKGDTGAKGDKGDKGDASGFRVIDSTGREIGVTDAYSYMPIVLPSVGILSFEVGPDGFEPYSDTPTLYHEAANCGGAAFVYHSQYDGFVQYPGVFNGTAYYAGEPVAQRTFASREYPTSTCSTGLTPRGFCCENSSVTFRAGPMQTIDTTSIGTPPFTIVY